MRAAIFQCTSGIDPAVNAGMLVDAVRQAAQGGADMLFTPEMVGCLDRNRKRAEEHLTDEAHDVVLAAATSAAREMGLWVHLGSLGLVGERTDGRWANRGFVIDGEGVVRARYDKIHLFDISLPDGTNWQESAVYGPGDGAVVVQTPWGRLGLSICYDLRFPDLYSRLSGAGATILLVPAAFTVPTGLAHWETLLRARAIESGCFVIAAAQVGDHEDGRETYGHSLVIDPWGEILTDIGDRPGMAFVDLDMTKVEAVRSRIPVVSHRRPIESVTIA